MKPRTLLIAAVMLLCLSALASAQSIYSTSSTPVTAVIANGNAEKVGDITFTGTGTSLAGTISVYYGGTPGFPISSLFSNIMVCTNAVGFTVKAGCPTGYGGFTGGTVTLGVDTIASSYKNPATVVIDIPAGMAGATATTPYNVTLSNVRVQISGNGSIGQNLVATISATNNLISAGSTSLIVINGIAAGLSGVASYTNAPPLPSSPTAGAPTLNTVTGALSGTNTTIKVSEGFLAAFTPGVGVRVTVTPTPPKGVSFTFPTTATSYNGTTAISSWVLGGSTSTTAATAQKVIDSSSTSTSSLQVNYYVATDLGDTVLEALEIPVAVASNSAQETFPLPAVNYTYTVTLAPVVSAFKSDGTPNTPPEPRFDALSPELGPGNLLTTLGSNTALFIPYAYASTTANDFNTAMAITNATEDPGTTILGFTGAAKQDGPVTFYLFPQGSATPDVYYTYKTIAGSPGAGLDGSGNVVHGSTYSVYLSQIFQLATPSSGTTTLGNNFTGYIIIVTNFTNAHGIFVISNFTTLTAQSNLMQVLSDRSVLPEKLGN